MPNIPYHLQRDAPIDSSQVIRALRGTQTQCRPQRGPARLAALVYPKGGITQTDKREHSVDLCKATLRALLFFTQRAANANRQRQKTLHKCA